MFADDTTLYKTHNNLRYLKWTRHVCSNGLVQSEQTDLKPRKNSMYLILKSGNKKEIHLEIGGIEVPWIVAE